MKEPKLSEHLKNDIRWAREHISEIADTYPDEWVAIVNKKVVSHGKDGAKVEEIAKMKTGKEQVYMVYAESGLRVY